MVLTLQLEHLVHPLDGRIMMQKWQWHGKYVIVITIPNNFDYILFSQYIYIYIYGASLCGLFLIPVVEEIQLFNSKINVCQKKLFGKDNFLLGCCLVSLGRGHPWLRFGLGVLSSTLVGASGWDIFSLGLYIIGLSYLLQVPF